MLKKLLILGVLSVILSGCMGCVVITIKENHTHIHHNQGYTDSVSTNTGSDAKDSLNGNTPSATLQLPVVP